jgi:hypothetical protein
MRILVDECIDERFRNSLPDHDCQTAHYAGLAGLKNGDLLTAAETVTLPRPEKELLITIRTGNYGSLERVLSLANSLFRELEEAEGRSRLLDKVDRARVSELVSET